MGFYRCSQIMVGDPVNWTFCCQEVAGHVLPLSWKGTHFLGSLEDLESGFIVSLRWHVCRGGKLSNACAWNLVTDKSSRNCQYSLKLNMSIGDSQEIPERITQLAELQALCLWNSSNGGDCRTISLFSATCVGSTLPSCPSLNLLS
eukprot:jgi/Botrbrau1/16043/Bobra.7_2s0017.1